MTAKLLTKLEEDVQSEIMHWLALEDVLAYQFAPPRTHKRLGGVVPDGWPDLLVIIPRRVEATRLVFERYIHLEIKREKGGKLSPKQVLRHQELDEAGCIVRTVRSVEEVAAVLRECGYSPRCAL